MNSSYLQKPQEVQRKWYVVDAANKPLGRVAATVSSVKTPPFITYRL